MGYHLDNELTAMSPEMTALGSYETTSIDRVSLQDFS